jgi:hypothetical protein
MSKAVTTVYVNIIRLLQRAAGWYSEGKLKHFASSIWRPYDLSFKDLIEEIAYSSRTVDKLASTASQLELREMHTAFTASQLQLREVRTEQRELCNSILDLRRYVAETQNLNYRGFLDSSRRICEIQFSQVLSFTSDTSLISPEDAFRFCQFRSNRRRQRTTLGMSPQWLSPQLHNWASIDQSSMLLVRGSPLHRHETKDFATDIVSLLRSVSVPVVWILGAPSRGETSVSPVDVLKQLIFQVLQINMTLLNTKSSSLSAVRFQTAKTEADWFNILASVVVGLPQLFLIVDAGLIEHELNGEIKWPDGFKKMIRDLTKACPDTIAKVILLGYGSNPFLDTSSAEEDFGNSTIHINGQKRQSSSWPRKRAPRNLDGSSRRPFSNVLRHVIYRKAPFNEEMHSD